MYNLVSYFIENNRCTSFFREYAKSQIDAAYRVMEYLDPDDIYPPKDLKKETIEHLVNENFCEAAQNIIHEAGAYVDSSYWNEHLNRDIEAECARLKPIWILKMNKEKLDKRESLLKQLQELDSELFNA